MLLPVLLSLLLPRGELADIPEFAVRTNFKHKTGMHDLWIVRENPKQEIIGSKLQKLKNEWRAFPVNHGAFDNVHERRGLGDGRPVLVKRESVDLIGGILVSAKSVVNGTERLTASVKVASCHDCVGTSGGRV